MVGAAPVVASALSGLARVPRTSHAPRVRRYACFEKVVAGLGRWRHPVAGVELVAVAWLAAACPAEPTPPPAEPRLVAPFGGWRRVEDPAQDAFAAMRPVDATCDPTGVGIEQLGLSFEIKTGLCDYATVAQPSASVLRVGDVLGIRGWHDELQAPMPSEGFVGVAIDGEILWHTTAAIPEPYGMFRGDLEIEEELPEGTELQVHIHNHGVNSWNLLDWKTVVDDGDAP